MYPARPSYYLTRFLILRLLGAIYAIAFLAAINQVLPLIGSNGLLPVGAYLQRIAAARLPKRRLSKTAIPLLVRP